MPTISVDPVDLDELLGFSLKAQDLERHLDVVKGELKGRDEQGRYRLELADTNRPDLWSAEGLARQIRAALGRRRDYPFFEGKSVAEIRAENSIRAIRPYVGAFIVRGLKVTELSLEAIIQTQEKLAENYGRRRKDVAIGVYAVDRITFPVRYQAVDPKKHHYTPLGLDEELSLADILERHPKGIQYRSILAGCDRVPLLVDAAGMILSMPPIVNSRAVGEVRPGDSDLFIEATGTDMSHLTLALNIMACDMLDRGGTIERVRTIFAYSTPFGTEVDLPRQLGFDLTLPVAEFGRLLGVPIQKVEIANVLERYGCDVRIEGDQVRVTPPPTRADYLHPVDAVEDFAIARGFDSFVPEMPRDFTPGRIAPIAALEDKIRDTLIGLGYEELITNILTSRTLLRPRVRRDEEPLVEVLNVMNENYAALRDALVPCLLQVEERSATAAYPHRLFEVGEVAIPDAGENVGSRTELHASALLVHREANLSEIHADLDNLLSQLSIDYTLREEESPLFIPGRSARVVVDGRSIGFLGELHPEVLANFALSMPAAAFELSLEGLV